MSTNLRRESLFVCCMFLLLVGLTNTVTAKGQASILSRVQTIDDRELGELIRVALENLPESKRLAKIHPRAKEYEEQKEAVEKVRLETVRLVTEAYVEIKLLDSQIEQTDAKLHSAGLPDPLARELILAKAELESQRDIKLAQLRETMHIIPKHALGIKPIKSLNGWLKLDVVGDRICVFNCEKPFHEYAYNMRHHFVKFATPKDIIAYVKDFIAEKDHLPVRIDILRNIEGLKISEDLHKTMINTIKTLSLEMEAEVHLDEAVRGEPPIGELFVERGKIGTRHRIRRSGRETIRELENLIDPNELTEYFHGCLLTRPGLLPQKINLVYEEDDDKDLALQITQVIEGITKKSGVQELVEITQQQAGPYEMK